MTPQWADLKAKWDNDPEVIEEVVRLERAEAVEAYAARLREAVEDFAAIEHDQWMTWARSVISADDVSIGPERLARWRSYMVPYADLSESVKEHDRVWARAVLDLIEREKP